MEAWMVWRGRQSRDQGRGGIKHKLYISPRLAALPAAFAGLVETMGETGCHFKIGSSAAGLLRPDKMVVYFSSQEDLLAAASRLALRLDGLPAHGVPFSAEIAGDGLLSWGMDPPTSETRLSWEEPESWRLWIARRLAAALVAAHGAATAGVEPGDFALERLRQEGVDVDEWTPSPSIWEAA
jgi:hypothetical protein